MKHTRIINVSYFVLLTSYFLFLCSCGPCNRFNPGSDASVTVEPVQMKESSPTVIIAGVLIEHDRVEVKLPHSAKLLEVYVNKGDVVTAGAPLAKLSDEEVNLKLQELRAAKKESEAFIEKNSYLLKNRDKLLEEGKLDKTQYDGLEIESQSNEATLNRIKTDLAVAEYNSAHLQITSPISGIVIEKYASPMMNAADNQLLFVIVNTDPINVSFQLSTNESAGVKTGMPITVAIEELDGKKFEASISYVGTAIQPTANTFDVLASIPNPGNVLKAGMQANAEFTSLVTHKVFAVPSSAIVTRDRDKFVFTVSGGTAHQTKVRIRSIQGGIAEISSGLAENDLIVAKGAQKLQDGSPVEIWRR